MGDVKNYPPCIRIVGAFSRYPEALTWLWDRVRAEWGEILHVSPPFDYTETAYYTKTMGEGLVKQFLVCTPGYDPASLAQDKLLTNRWESEYKEIFDCVEPRPLNIDPGYVALTKLVLASTKNREHRIYLQDGIYAEVTLAFRDQVWKPMEWTYPDYKREDFQMFFCEARKILLSARR